MDALLTQKTVIAGIVLVSLFLLERVLPFRAARAKWSDYGRNVGIAALSALASRWVVLPVTAVAAASLPGWRPPTWETSVLLLLIDLLILDLWIYWWHRANHEIQFLWRFHRVHHLDETLDVTTSLRFHVGEVMLSAVVRASVIIALDIPLATVLLFELFVLVAAGFQHANVNLPAKLDHALRFVIVTPAHHRVHHHAVRADTDAHYGAVLTVWDRIFRSWRPTHVEPTDRIGVEREKDLSLTQLVAAPLFPERKTPATD